MSKEAFGISMETEIFKDIPGLESVAQASNWGRFKVLPYDTIMKNGVPRHYSENYPKISTQGQVSICGKQYMANKLIAQTFIPDYIEGMPLTNNNGDITDCRLDNISCSINFMAQGNNPIPYNITLHGDTVEGGFSEGQRILFDITLANKVGKPIGDLRRDNVIPNLKNMTKGIDYIDLMEYSNLNEYLPLLLDLGYTEEILRKTIHIYIFSERGVTKLMSSLQNTNPVKWEFLNNFVNEYFGMREQIKNQQNTLEQQKKDLLFAIYTGGQAGIIASKQLTELEVQEATAPLIDTIEKQKPKVEKYKEYVDSDGYITPRMAAQLLKLPHPTAQAFNKLLKEHRVQYKNGKNWVLYEDFSWMLKEGYCKQVPYIDSTGTTHYNLRWTPRGIDYISTNILAVT